MAEKQAVSKSQAVRDYLNAHPGAGCREIATALDMQGIKITLGHVATVKMIDDAKKAAGETAAPLAVENQVFQASIEWLFAVGVAQVYER